VEGIADRINNPYKPSNVAKEYVEELGFYKSMVFCGVKYDEMLLNLRPDYWDWETKFDIVLINEDSVVIIEIMDENVPPEFIPKFSVKKIEQFRELFPEFKSLKAYLGIAAFSFRKNVKFTLA
jgi:hypothetical protein